MMTSVTRADHVTDRQHEKLNENSRELGTSASLLATRGWGGKGGRGKG